MKISYHEDVDILSIVFKSQRVKVSEEVLPGVVVDYDDDGRVTAFEIMDASKFTDLSHVNIFVSMWGQEERVLDSNGEFSLAPRTVKSIPTGD